jgi:LDH2 family malate/lactate/ureidoglycolate dehydrogenase
MVESRLVPADELQELTCALFVAADTPRRIAEVVATILVNSNLAGHDSHGVLRVPAYLRAIEAGTLRPAAEPVVVREAATTLLIDGQGGFGHYTAQRALELALAKAQQSNVCCVSFTQVGHVGRLGEYAEQAAARGCIGLITVGSGSNRDTYRVVPHGGGAGAGVLGTNPIAIGVPTGDDRPFVLDYATSVLAEGKVQVARSKGLPMPPGVILDNRGEPTTNPHDFYDHGYLLPMGGHKGYALSLAFCLLAGLGGYFQPETQGLAGAYMQVVNVAAFLPLTTYQQNVRSFLEGIKAVPAAPGVEEILVPGEPEYRSRQQRLATGVPIPETILTQLQEWAEKLHVSVE